MWPIRDQKAVGIQSPCEFRDMELTSVTHPCWTASQSPCAEFPGPSVLRPIHGFFSQCQPYFGHSEIPGSPQCDAEARICEPWIHCPWQLCGLSDMPPPAPVIQVFHLLVATAICLYTCHPALHKCLLACLSWGAESFVLTSDHQHRAWHFVSILWILVGCMNGGSSADKQQE